MNNLPTFKLEEYLNRYEFTAPHLLCCSDAESMGMQELLSMANTEEQQLWQNLRLSYTESTGHPLLRATIAQALYPALQADNILCFAGAEDGIFCALNALCQPKDHIIVGTPCYQSLLSLPQARDCAITPIELKEENQWQLNIEQVRKAITPATKLMVINFPHNPTGQILDPATQQELIALLDQHGIWLFSDEVYLGLGVNPNPWAQPAATQYKRALSLGVMSKSFGMAGLRIGWIACQDKTLLEKIAAIKNYTSICNSGPSEILSIIALRNKETILARTNEIVRKNRIILDQFFLKYAHLFSWVPPQGGCTGFVRYLGKGTVEEFCEKVRTEAGILLMPASVYDTESKHFRIGFGRSNMPAILSKFEQWLKSLVS